VGLFGFLFVGSFGCSCVLRGTLRIFNKTFLIYQKKKTAIMWKFKRKEASPLGC
jgi:hypothetical protein